MELIKFIIFAISAFFSLLYIEHKANILVSRICKEPQNPNDYFGAVLFSVIVIGWSGLFYIYQLS